jgi:hypothetical protein
VLANTASGTVVTITVTDNFTLDYTTAKKGTYYFIFTIGGTGSYTMTLATAKFRRAAAPTLSTVVGRVDVMQCVYDGTHMQVVSFETNLAIS